MKTLYILRPHSGWTYCGGLACVIAHSFDEVVSLIMKEKERGEEDQDFSLSDVGVLQEREGSAGCYVWVLEKTVGVTDDAPIGIVAMSYNYA